MDKHAFLVVVTIISVIFSCYASFLQGRARGEDQERSWRTKNRSTFFLFLGLIGLAIVVFRW